MQILVMIATLVFTCFYRPMVVVDAWQWFVVPLGVNALHYWQAFGLSVFVGMMTVGPSDVKSDAHPMALCAAAVLVLVVAHLVMWLVSP